MSVKFSVCAWSGVGPGLHQPQQWQQWIDTAGVPEGEVPLDVSHIPAMARRRLGHLAKMAVSVADDVLQQCGQHDIPVVWASRYGDADKSLALLRTHVQAQEALSPTAFGLSVHNGIGAQHSILRGVHANAVCVASSHCAPEAAMVEAAALLHEGAAQVLCVVYDRPLPDPYTCYHDETALDMAWAVLLRPAEQGQPHFTLQALEEAPQEAYATATPAAAALPHALDVWRFVLDAQCAQLTHVHPHGVWQWRRAHA